MALLSAVVVAALAVAEPGGTSRVPDLRFGHLTIDDGLSRSWVYSVLRDSRGFLWVGTRGGLDRYDGERVVSYAGRSSWRRGPRGHHSGAVRGFQGAALGLDRGGPPSVRPNARPVREDRPR